MEPNQKNTHPLKVWLSWIRAVGVCIYATVQNVHVCGTNERKFLFILRRKGAFWLLLLDFSEFKGLRWRCCTRGAGSRVGVEGVRGRTDAGGVDGGQDALVSFYGSPQDEQ